MIQRITALCLMAFTLFMGNAQTAQVTEIKIVADNDTIMETPDIMPEYKGGLEGLMGFLGSNLVYPTECAENDIQGKVLVKFVVTKNGTVDNVEVAKSVHPLLDAEAVRVVSLLQDWIPGEVNGEAVNVYYTLPINFRLNNAETIEAQIKAEDWVKFKQLAEESEKEGNIYHAIAYYWECFDINPHIVSPLERIMQINNGETKYGSNSDILNKAYDLIITKENSPFNEESYAETFDWIVAQLQAIDPDRLKLIKHENNKN